MSRTPSPLTPRERELDARMAAFASSRGGAVNGVQARTLGARTGDIRRLMQAGFWTRPRRGVYADARHASAAADPVHAAAAAAALAAMEPGVVVSHVSGVRLLSLPRPRWVPDTVSLTRRPPAHGNDAAGTDVHVADFDDADVIYVDGVPVLGRARLVVDNAHVLSGADALAVADGALRANQTTVEDLREAVVGRSGVPFHRGAAVVADRADPGAENWFESISRWWMLEAGFPRPQLQVPLVDDAGEVRARVDMLLEEEGVVGEADGEGKYAEGPRVLYDEKRREDWIRQACGLEVVRWVPVEMQTRRGRAQVMQRWTEAIRRADSRRQRRRNA